MGFVVTGGGRGAGRAVVERLAGEPGTVVVIEFDAVLPVDGGRSAVGRDPQEH